MNIERDIDVLKVMEVLPHRYPFLFIDKILELDLENLKVKAIKNVSINEYFFQGHFPEYPVMPGVLVIEAMAQVGAYMMLRKAGFTKGEKTVFFASIEEAKFRKQILPGDQIVFEVEGINIKRNSGKIKGIAKVNEEIACEAVLLAVVR